MRAVSPLYIMVDGVRGGREGIREIYLTLFLISMSAPLSSNSWTTSLRPSIAAHMRGVLPNYIMVDGVRGGGRGTGIFILHYL